MENSIMELVNGTPEDILDSLSRLIRQAMTRENLLPADVARRARVKKEVVSALEKSTTGVPLCFEDAESLMLALGIELNRVVDPKDLSQLPPDRRAYWSEKLKIAIPLAAIGTGGLPADTSARMFICNEALREVCSGNMSVA